VHENNAEKYKKIFLPKKVLKNKKIVPVFNILLFPIVQHTKTEKYQSFTNPNLKKFIQTITNKVPVVS